ncbi:MAG: acylphosphatase [Spirochaetota bacterium]
MLGPDRKLRGDSSEDPDLVYLEASDEFFCQFHGRHGTECADKKQAYRGAPPFQLWSDATKNKRRAPASAFHAIAQGRVQGVGFRYSACHKARSLGLSGWVRNLENGDVETLAEGDPRALAAYEAWLTEGPPGSRVDRLLSTPRPPTGAFTDFQIELDDW